MQYAVKDESMKGCNIGRGRLQIENDINIYSKQTTEHLPIVLLIRGRCRVVELPLRN